MMKFQQIPLCALPLGGAGIVRELAVSGATRRRMLDLGLVQGTRVEAVLRSPAGDPKAYRVRGALIALRSEEAGQILVECPK